MVNNSIAAYLGCLQPSFEGHETLSSEWRAGWIIGRGRNCFATTVLYRGSHSSQATDFPNTDFFFGLLSAEVSQPNTKSRLVLAKRILKKTHALGLTRSRETVTPCWCNDRPPSTYTCYGCQGTKRLVVTVIERKNP